MENVSNIKSIQIDCGNDIKIEITGKDKTIIAIVIESIDKEFTQKFKALTEFIHFNKLNEKTKVNFNGTHHGK